MRNYVLLLVFLLSNTVFAKSESHQILTRDRYLQNESILAVGDCAYTREAFADSNEKGFSIQEKYYLTYSVCAEKQQYEVKLTGNYWDTQEEFIPDSATQPYFEAETRHRDFYVGMATKKILFSAKDLLNYCLEQKRILENKLALDISSGRNLHCNPR